MSAHTFAATYGDESLPVVVEALSAGIYGGTAKPADLGELRKLLVAARRRYRQSDSARSASRLPPLNP